MEKEVGGSIRIISSYLSFISPKGEKTLSKPHQTLFLYLLIYKSISISISTSIIIFLYYGNKILQPKVTYKK